MAEELYNLIINFTGHKQIRLELEQDEGRVEAVDFSFDRNLDTLLIENIDKILKRNRITALSLGAVKVAGAVDPNSSAYKIVQTWIEAIKS